MANLDRVFSQYIRLKDADHAGYVKCWTCDKVKNWREVDAGHFQSRGKYSTRWDESNVKPQCKKCNMYNGGHQYQFGLNLDFHYGKGTAERLILLGNQTRRYSDAELESMIREYRKKLDDLL